MHIHAHRADDIFTAVRIAKEFNIDYVIVHELAHIRHKNHGPDFWAAVGEVLPDYQQRRRRLSMPPVGPPR